MNRHERRRQSARGWRRHGSHLFYNPEGVDPAAIETALRNSAGLDVVTDGDRAWFAANPGRDFRLRPIAEAEVGVHLRRKPDEGSGHAAYTLVYQIKPGIRSRICFTAYPLHQPETFCDAACNMIFAEVTQRQPEFAETFKALASAIGGDAP